MLASTHLARVARTVPGLTIWYYVPSPQLAASRRMGILVSVQSFHHLPASSTNLDSISFPFSTFYYT